MGFVRCRSNPACAVRRLSSSLPQPVTATSNGARQCGVAAQPDRDVVAVDAGHADVAEDDVGHELLRRLDARGPAVGDAGVVSFRLEQVGERLGHVRVVVDDEHLP